MAIYKFKSDFTVGVYMNQDILFIIFSFGVAAYLSFIVFNFVRGTVGLRALISVSVGIIIIFIFDVVRLIAYPHILYDSSFFYIDVLRFGVIPIVFMLAIFLGIHNKKMDNNALNIAN